MFAGERDRGGGGGVGEVVRRMGKGSVAGLLIRMASCRARGRYRVF